MIVAVAVGWRLAVLPAVFVLVGLIGFGHVEVVVGETPVGMPVLRVFGHNPAPSARRRWCERLERWHAGGARGLGEQGGSPA